MSLEYQRLERRSCTSVELKIVFEAISRESTYPVRTENMVCQFESIYKLYKTEYLIYKASVEVLTERSCQKAEVNLKVKARPTRIESSVPLSSNVKISPQNRVRR